MFDNIGGKIKVLAKCICWLGIIGSIICAIALFSANSYYNPTIGLGIGVLIGGCLGSWVGSFFAYAFGEIVENSGKQASYSYQLLEEQNKTTAAIEALRKQSHNVSAAPQPEAVQAKDVSFHLSEL